MTKLIGLIGAAGSGKDTVAKLLGYKKLSFAGTVKDVASIAFCWDRDLLEGVTPESRAFRETWMSTGGSRLALLFKKLARKCFGTSSQRTFG